ncbi:hypothetical protein [Paenibacillus sp. UASWS1643]|uniref:hypothetical protein n=1 Tax=Paenibacillus sp. UASWS1643 TaxID=2580422 RepID=UPI0012393D37|nr:hypothetical protein [Paenibacillus sp. UASWS1643]KAA8750111.1 hypothetical protein FE296_16060 [Paenibacillus sp. UASWS1643]
MPFEPYKVPLKILINNVMAHGGEFEVYRPTEVPISGEVTIPLPYSYTHSVTLSDMTINTAIMDRLMDIKRGNLYPDIDQADAQAAIMYLIETRTPIKYWALKLLFTIARCDIGRYKWSPVEVRPGETMEHAYRRVQLGSTSVTDSVEVIIVSPDQLITNASNTLF